MNKHREMFLTLVLLCLIPSCICEVTQLEAEEGTNVTLQWNIGDSIATEGLVMSCFYRSAHRPVRHSLILEVVDGKLLFDSTRGRFSGRLSLDREALGLGQVRILLTRFTAQDQGLYGCSMYANFYPPSQKWRYKTHVNFNLTVATKPAPTRSGETKYSVLDLVRNAILCFMYSVIFLTAILVLFAMKQDDT